MHSTDVIVDEESNDMNSSDRKSTDRISTSDFDSANNNQNDDVYRNSENCESIAIEVKNDGKEEFNSGSLDKDKNLSPPRSVSVKLDSNNIISYESRLSFIVEDENQNTLANNENYDIAAKLVDAMRGPQYYKNIKLRRTVAKETGRVIITFFNLFRIILISYH